MSEHVENLRKELAGMVELLEILRSDDGIKYHYAKSRGGSMVLVSDAINSAKRVLESQQGQEKSTK